MERRIAALLTSSCLLWCGAVCGQDATPRSGREGPANLPEASDSQKSEAGREGGTKAGESAGGAVQPGAAPAIVIGFVGGFVRHENAVHSPVQLGARLRKAYPEGVYVEVFENRHREEAHSRILKLLDASSGKLSEEQKRDARIVIYGMSWGGSETVALAKELKAQNIPVLLTVQVDSVAKPWEDDGVIPSNVGEAVNFYQQDGLLHGRAKISAEDAERTRILGNFQYKYKTSPLTCEGYPWWDLLLTKYHTKIECDPTVWNRVEGLIREKLPPVHEGNGAPASEAGQK